MSPRLEKLVPAHPKGVNVSPPDAVSRRAENWDGLSAEYSESRDLVPFAYSIRPTHHLFVCVERGLRRDGETRVEGLPSSTLRNLTRRICVVPAGHQFEGWHVPSIPVKATVFHIETDWPLLDPELLTVAAPLRAQLWLDSSSIEATAAKLKALIGSKDPGDRLYAESLCVVLQHELFRLACGTVGARRPKGALAPWQEKRVRDYIEENLAGPLSLALLAQLVGLSTFHFARAFKRTFGQPPHRYYSSRRIEGAKALLAARGHSVTDVALALGFSETSAFTSAFRKATGLTPSEYRREHR